MILNDFMRAYAEDINGTFTSYNETKAIVIVPLSGKRFQTVLGIIKTNALYNRQMIIFSSKICLYKDAINLCELLKQASLFNYSRFIIEDDHLNIQATTSIESPVSEMQEIVQEVANLADQYEMALVGSDIY